MPVVDAHMPAVKPEVGGVFSWFLVAVAGEPAAFELLRAERPVMPAGLRALLACWERPDPSAVARSREQPPALPGRRPVVLVARVDGAPEDRGMHARQIS